MSKRNKRLRTLIHSPSGHSVIITEYGVHVADVRRLFRTVVTGI